MTVTLASPEVLQDSSALWLGIDLGTQSVKVVIVTDQGHICASAQAPLTSHRSGVVHEQDPLEWINATKQILAEAIGALDQERRGSICGLAICSTSGTLAMVDDLGAPIGAGIMYDDARAAGLQESVVTADPEYWAHTGTAPQPSWAITKMAWLAKERLLSGVTQVVHQGDVVAAAMTGGPVATDWSSALKSGYDLQNQKWPSALLARIGFPENLLPQVVASGDRLGTTSAEWEAATNLPEGTPVFAGSTDGCAAQFGAGALGLGSWHSIIGTTLVLKGVTEEPVTNTAAGIYSHLAPQGDVWLPGGASSVGAGALTAFLPEDTDLSALTEVARGSWATDPQPITYPLVSPGERFPLSDPEFAGFLLLTESSTGTDGVNNSTCSRPLSALNDLSPEEVLSAIFIGVAAVERLCFERLGVLGPVGYSSTTASPIRLSTSGGGARNKDWVRLRASMLGVPITRLADAEGSLGMAVIAAWGAQKGLANAPELTKISENMSAVLDVIPPDPELKEPLAKAYARFTKALTQNTNPKDGEIR